MAAISSACACRSTRRWPAPGTCWPAAAGAAWTGPPHGPLASSWRWSRCRRPRSACLASPANWRTLVACRPSTRWPSPARSHRRPTPWPQARWQMWPMPTTTRASVAAAKPRSRSPWWHAAARSRTVVRVSGKNCVNQTTVIKFGYSNNEPGYSTCASTSPCMNTRACDKLVSVCACARRRVRARVYITRRILGDDGHYRGPVIPTPAQSVGREK